MIVSLVMLFQYLRSLYFLVMCGVLVVMLLCVFIRRWLLLDEEAGRAMFKRLVDEVRGTFKGVEYNE